MTGYELATNYKECLDALLSEEDETTTEAYLETLNMLEDSIEDKAENTCHVIKELERQSDFLASEIKRLQAMKKSIDGNAKRVTEMLDNWLKVADIDKLQTPHYRIGYRKSVRTVILDESKVPKRFIVMTPKISLTDVKEYLKEHSKCKFARLEETKNLNIK